MTPPATDDEELARRAASGDGTAFDELVNRYGVRVIGFFRASSIPDPDDAAQDVWLRVWRTLATFATDRSGKAHHFRGWLFQIARNLAIEWGRRRRLPTAADSDVIVLHADPRRVSEPDARAKLTECLDRLPDQYRRLLVGRMEEASYEELATALKLKVGTVKSGISRGRELLAECLGPYAE